MEIGLLAAFLGGSLALLSPCGALLLPGFFASSVTSRAALLPHAAVFYLGLVLTLVPLGVGAGTLGSLMAGHRDLLIIGTSLMLVVLGALHALGLGGDLARLVPGAERLHRLSAQGSGYPRSLLLGAAGGIAGFCAGPILGAVLTLALGQGGAARAGVLLAVYGAGMVVPMMLLAALWHRLDGRALSLLRGRGVSVRGRRLHTTTVLTGVLIIALGILFWATNGLVELPSPVPTGVLARWQESSAALDDPLVQVLVILSLGLLGLGLWWRSERRRRR